MSDLTKLIAPSFYGVHHDIKAGRHTHYWLKGGRGSTKSSFISVEIISRNCIYSFRLLPTSSGVFSFSSKEKLATSAKKFHRQCVSMAVLNRCPSFLKICFISSRYFINIPVFEGVICSIGLFIRSHI